MFESKKIILVGAGGHAKSVVEVLRNSQDAFTITGYLDNDKKDDPYWNRFSYLGSDQNHQIQNDHVYHISVGMIKNVAIRQQLFEYLCSKGAAFPQIRSKHAIVSKDANCSNGSIIMHHAIINAGAEIGQNSIINTKALIEHDTVIGNHCHISTGAIVNADCKIGNNVFISSNVCINRGVTIGNNSIIGSGAVVTKNIGPNSTVYGVPAK